MIAAKATAPGVSTVRPHFHAMGGVPVDLVDMMEPSAATEVGPSRVIQRISIKK